MAIWNRDHKTDPAEAPKTEPETAAKPKTAPIETRIGDGLDDLIEKLPGFAGKKWEKAKEYWNSDKVTAFRKRTFRADAVTELGDGAYAITEAMIPVVFLFVGEEKALLINTGFGWKGVKTAVDSLTDKPVEVVVTHASPLTIGGAGAYDKVLMRKSEIRKAKLWNKSKLRTALSYVHPGRYALGLTDDDVIKKDGTFRELKGSEIDLGGRTVEILDTPAESVGQLCFKDQKTGIVVSGDLCGPLLFMVSPSGPTLEDCRNSVETVQKAAKGGKNYSMFSAKPVKESRTENLRLMLNKAINKGNKTDQVIKLANSDDLSHFLFYLPWRTQKEDFSDKLSKILNSIQ